MAENVPANFELHIRDPLPDGSFPVTARVAVTDQQVEGRFVLPVDDAAATAFLSAFGEGTASPAEVQEFGSSLFNALFQGRIRDLYISIRASHGSSLRYRLILDAPLLARLPWELLYDPERRVFLALETSLVRGFGLAEPSQPLQVQPPLRILVSAAFPRDLPTIEGQDEIGTILHELADLVRRRDAEVVQLGHTTLRSLQNALREAATQGQPFHILHVIAHGAYDHHAGHPVLFLEDDQGRAQPVDPTVFADVLRPFDLKLVYLNACETAALSALDLTQGFAPALMAIGTPAVIGMQVAVWDRLARQVAQDFYAALADNQPVDQALLSARQLARGEPLREAGIAVPVCYLRTASGQIVDLLRPETLTLSRATWRPWLKAQATPKKLVQVTLELVALVSAVLGIYWGVTSSSSGSNPAPTPTPTPLAPMAGDFKIAVAAFSQLNPQGHAVQSRSGSELAQEVATQIDGTVQALRDAGYIIPIYGPDLVGFIGGADDSERARQAEERLQELNADLLLYGHLARSPDSTALTPRLYLSASKLRRAGEELPGDYVFGDPIRVGDDIDANPEASRQLREALAQRSAGLADFVVGLGNFTLNRFQDAQPWFEEALHASADARVRRIIYLFLGSTAGKLERLPDAQRYYEQALQEDERYARARLGLAQVRFLQSRGGCDAETTNAQVLEDVLADYDAAARLTGDAASEIPVKVSLFRGDVELCLSQARAGDHWDEALSDFQAVIDEFDRRSDPVAQLRIRYLAAEAYAMKGLALRWRSADKGCAATDDLADAEKAFDKAIELSREPARQAVYALHLAAIHLCRQECRAAEDALQQADGYYRQHQDQNPAVDDPDFEVFRAGLQETLSRQCLPGPDASTQ